MNVLALELSSGRGSIALLEADREPVAFEFPNDRKHSGAFFETLQRITEKHPVPPLIAVGIGPGSYAGVRIAISTAVGLAAAGDAQLVGIPSVVALSVEETKYDVIGDARRQTFFHVSVVCGRCVAEPTLFSATALQEKLAASDAAVYCTEPLPLFPRVKIATPSALLLARLAVSGTFLPSAAALEPIYLREPHITRPKSQTTAFARADS